MEEEEFKGLEEEIDSAIERLFVEKKRGPAKSSPMESLLSENPLQSSFSEPTNDPPILKPLHEAPVLEPLKTTPVETLIETTIEPSFDLSLEPSSEPPSEFPSELTIEPSSIEKTFTGTPIKSYPLELEPPNEVEKTLDFEGPPPGPPPVPMTFLKSIEKMEAQLLSLEWEITGEKLKKTREEVILLKDLMKQKADISSILTWMDKVLTHMIKNEENIQPPWIKFLLDSKETIKLLMKKDTERETQIYKQLAYHGIEARFSCLREMEEASIPSPSLPLREESVHEEIFVQAGKGMEEALNQMNSVSGKMDEVIGKMDEVLGKMDIYLSEIRPLTSKFSELLEDRTLRVNVTIFKVDEKLFGVESQKVFKLFKVPNTFQEKYSNQPKVRLRDLEVEMIDLKKLLSIHTETPKDEIRILTVKDNGRVRGFMIDEVLSKLSALSDQRRGGGEYFSGVIQYTYQEQPVEIPILDLNRF